MESIDIKRGSQDIELKLTTKLFVEAFGGLSSDLEII